MAPLCKISSGAFIFVYLLYKGYSQRFRILTNTGMTTQVRRMTMPTATKSACRVKDRPLMRGFSSQGPNMLTGQTPRTVTRAIFQGGGGIKRPLPRKDKPGFQAGQLLVFRLPFGQRSNRYFPLLENGRFVKTVTGRRVRKSAQNAVFTRPAPLNRAHDTHPQLALGLKRSGDEIM